MRYRVTLEIDIHPENYYSMPDDPEVWDWTTLIGDPTEVISVEAID